MTLQTPPSPDEFEFSLFGPGIGECAVLHLGEDHWVVVDSCCTSSGEPVALAYLRAIDRSPLRIQRVIVTHWHDDHVRGIARVFKAATSARLVLSSALNDQEHMKLFRLAREQDPHGSGVDDLSDLFNELIQRHSGADRRFAAPIWAAPNQTLFRTALASGEVVEVVALSPSNTAQQRSRVAIAELVHRAETQTNGRRIVALTPNESSVAIGVVAGEATVLLGSDLEVTNSANDGWAAIVADHVAYGRTGYRIVKVPHHGSETAHLPSVWATMVHAERLAALTPFRRCHLPGEKDVARLHDVTGALYLTAQAKLAKINRPREVARQIDQVAKNMRPLWRGEPGHVRVRMKIAGGAAQVETFDGAQQLQRSA